MERLLPFNRIERAAPLIHARNCLTGPAVLLMTLVLLTYLAAGLLAFKVCAPESAALSQCENAVLSTQRGRQLMRTDNRSDLSSDVGIV